MAFDTITGTKAIDLTALPGSIPDTQLVLVPDPVTGELYRSTFGQMKADIILQIGDLSYLDDIIEVPTVDALPQPGQVKKIYVITSGPDANTQWRWGGSIYIQFPQGSGDVAGEAILRGNADAVLQSNIDAEAAARQNADTTLQNNINAEATNRTNADITINNRVSAEINARTTNDNILNAKIDAEGQIRATADNNLQSQINLKLNASDYNQHYKGKFTSLAALQAALPAAAPGDYAQVDTGAGNDVKNYNWDDEEGWVIGGTVAASTTDALPEGSTNLYFTTERAQAAVDISGKADKTYVDDADQALSDRIDAIQPAPSPTGSRIISGCKESWSGTGLTFDVTTGTYQIQGTPYTFSGDSKTLIPADATSPRFDVLALNTSQQLIVITGTPGANPDIPQVDPDSQLYLTAIYVAAGATTPVNVDLSLIYSENAEWVGAANGLTVDFNDTTSPFSGTKDIKVSGGTNGGYLSLTADIAPDITNYSLLKLYIKLNTVLNNKSNIVAAFYSLNKQITQFVTLPINKNLTGSYQNISIDITNFQFSKSLFDTIRFTFTGTTFSAFYLDYIQLQGTAGSTQIVNVQDATTTTKGIVKLAGDLAGTADAPTVPALASLQSQITTLDSTKLNAADYNDRYKGKYTTLSALQTAHPTAIAGDYAQVDAGAGSDVKNYNYDLEDGWVLGSSSGSGATNTDALPEGSTNLYFTTARAQAAISGTANRISVTAGVIDISPAYVGQNTITILGTIATGTWQGTAIGSGYGGTGFSSYAKGDIIYASAANTLSKLAVGTDGYVLTLVAGLPVWKAAAGGGGGGIYAGTGAAFTSYAAGDLIYASAANTLSKLPADTDGKVLTMLSGVPVWSAAGVSWSRSGNAGTVAGTDFIGTTDDVDFIVKRNNSQILKIMSSSISFGSASSASPTNTMSFGTSAGSGFTNAAGGSNFFGYQAGYTATNAARSNFFGQSAGQSASGASYSNFFGYQAGYTATNAIESNFIGESAGSGATSASQSNFIGVFAGQGATGAKYSNFIGYNVGHSVITGINNILIGTNITTPTNTSANMFSLGNVLYGFNTYSVSTGSPATSAQTTGKISVGTNAPDASAILDLTSTTMGFLPPRMTTTNWGAISLKAEGLQGWSNSDHGQLWYDGARTIGFRYNGTKFQGYDGTSWLDLN